MAVAGGTYLVGPDSASGLAAGTSGRAQTENYSATPEYLALTRGALYFTGLTQIDTLCLGLPVHLFAQRKAVVESHAKGTHSVRGRTIQVNRVIVVPQPMGALVHLGKQDKLRAETVLIIDVGFGTVDWLLVETQNGKRKMVPARSGGQPIGVRELIESMLRRRPEGIVVTGGRHTARGRKLLEQSGIPVIETWDLPQSPVRHVVGFSNAQASAALVKFSMWKPNELTVPPRLCQSTPESASVSIAKRPRMKTK